MEIAAAWCDAERLWVALSDGRRLGVPLAWFPRLVRASAEAREAVEISAFGLPGETLDEGVSVVSVLAGRKADSAGGKYLVSSRTTIKGNLADP